MDGRRVRDYREFMNSAHLRRSAVTWVAAYAVALHALLSAIAPIAPAIAADPLAVLCTHDTDDSGAPARNDHPCAAICAAMGHGLAAITPPGMTAAVALTMTDEYPYAFAQIIISAQPAQ